jgi:hypothetical protein
VTNAFGPVTAIFGVPAANTTAPKAAGSLPALKVTLPRVVVSATPLTLTLAPADQDMAPSVVVTAAARLIAPAAVALTLAPVVSMAPFTFTFTSRPATKARLPLVVVVVTAAFRFTSRPASITRLPPVVVMAALITTSLTALSVKVWAVLHVTASFTITSPLTPAPPLLLEMVKSVLARLVVTAAGVMSPPAASAAMTKSFGSINQLPLLPRTASVVTRALSAICTSAAEVSTKPPLPPEGAEASSWPLSASVPSAISPSKRIAP